MRRLSRESSPPLQQHQPSPQQQLSPHLLGPLQRLRRTSLLRSRKILLLKPQKLLAPRPRRRRRTNLSPPRMNWQEADFSFEDAPAPPSKESITTGVGRKNLTAVVENPEDADSEMQEADAPPVAHPGSSSKRKGRSTSQGGAQKRALPLKSPRSSSDGPKLKAAPVGKTHQQDAKGCFTTSHCSWQTSSKATTEGYHPIEESCSSQTSAGSCHCQANCKHSRIVMGSMEGASKRESAAISC